PLLEITARKDHRCGYEENRDVKGRISRGQEQVADRNWLRVNHLRLDIELSEIRQNPVQPSCQLRSRRRVDDLLEVSKIGTEMPDDEEAEREGGGKNRCRKRGKEKRNGGNDHQLDENQRHGLQDRGIESRRIPRSLNVRRNAPPHICQNCVLGG